MSDELATTRREVIAAELDKLETQDVSTPEPVAEPQEAPQAEAAPEEKPSRTAGRARDEKGRLLPGKVEKPVAEAAPVVEQPAPVVEKIPRPSSWKKDYWNHWEKLDPSVAKYINEREQQFSSGVSTYKQEAERAKEYIEAVTPFLPELQQHGIKPTDWIRSLGQAHRTMALGQPHEKLAMFQKLAQDYGIPLQNVVQGQVTPDMQYYSALQEQVRQLQGQFQNYQQMSERQQQATIESELAAFAAKNEHFESVRETMSGLLSAGLAQDLQSAYDAALRLPKHSDLFDAMQQQQSEAEARRKAEEAKAVAARARAKVTSVKSATPTGAEGNNGKRDRRQIIAEAAEQYLGGGRV